MFDDRDLQIARPKNWIKFEDLCHPVLTAENLQRSIMSTRRRFILDSVTLIVGKFVKSKGKKTSFLL